MASNLSLYQPKTQSISNSLEGLLDVDRIYANPVYTCTIQGSSGIIKGIYNSDSPFGIGIESNFVDQFSLPPAIEQGLEALRAGTNWIANMSGKSQFILKSMRMTEQRWDGSSSPTFQIRIDVPIVRRTDVQWKVLQYALKATAGTRTSPNANGQTQHIDEAWVIYAPNGYHVNYSSGDQGDQPVGTHTIQLGSGNSVWFRMTNAVITSMNFSIGPKKYYDGNPTSVSLDIGFKYWRYALYEEAIKWFPKLNLGGNL